MPANCHVKDCNKPATNCAALEFFREGEDAHCAKIELTGVVLCDADAKAATADGYCSDAGWAEILTIFSDRLKHAPPVRSLTKLILTRLA